MPAAAIRLDPNNSSFNVWKHDKLHNYWISAVLLVESKMLVFEKLKLYTHCYKVAPCYIKLSNHVKVDCCYIPVLLVIYRMIWWV